MGRLAIRLSVLGLLLATLQGGCARYEFELVEPADLSQRIGRSSTATVTVDPLKYAMQSVDGRLVLRIWNPTDRAITLLGVQSAAVSSGGQSHPLPAFTIAPQSHGRLTIPPIPPSSRTSGPRMSMGVGMGRSSGGRQGMSSSVGVGTGTSHRTVHSDGGIMFWTWSGQTDVRLLLRYTDGENEFDHSFVFGRRRT